MRHADILSQQRTVMPSGEERARFDARLGNERLRDDFVVAQLPILNPPIVSKSECGFAAEGRNEALDSSCQIDGDE
jgi:hypothetical protein